MALEIPIFFELLDNSLTGIPTLLAIFTPFIPPWHIPTMRAQISFGTVMIYQCGLTKSWQLLRKRRRILLVSWTA
jgi:hypothetical protein